MADHVFIGFGFGPIQSGLFAKEAFQSGNFTRIVVAEIDSHLVDAVRANNGGYYVNVARSDGIETLKIDNVELLDPGADSDRKILLEALAESTEIVTSLPSVSFYDAGGANSVVSLIAEGLRRSTAAATIVYTAENNNHAAEILGRAVSRRSSDLRQQTVSRASSPRIEGGTPSTRVQFLNTVIGKMSRVVGDPAEIAQLNLKPIAPGLGRAFLVEQFNRILVTRAQIEGFIPGIEVLVEKDDLLPFEEAKLYGHNAIHSLLGFIGALEDYATMTELKDDDAVMQVGRDAFLEESGAALIKKYAHLDDELFTQAGFEDYADDLLERMTNPYLGDTIARVVRDLPRKLEMNGRIFGTMQLAIEYGIEPRNMALGALAGIAELLKKADENNLPEELRFADWRNLDEGKIGQILNWLWNGQTCESVARLIEQVGRSGEPLGELTHA
ncbi:MAG: mannitol dehydrogenase family protein [Planctomycetota bacterium]|jgi:mannitol-1-phosphate/altronate dehydrogenase